VGAVLGDSRVARGGSWGGSAWSVRSATRHDGGPSIKFEFLGFRVARNAQ
jgi:formylglycine-generating enzyme required for sulfatase activity